MYIYYDSKTGNVERFVNKIKSMRENWSFIKIDEGLTAEQEGHLITFTTKIGQMPESTANFLDRNENYKKIKSVSSSGNMNWGMSFAMSANKVSEKYDIPIAIKFELSGTQSQVNDYIKYLEEIG